MTYRKSAAPYLCLLILLIVGVPVVNYQVEQAQSISIEIKEKSVQKLPAPIAFK